MEHDDDFMDDDNAIYSDDDESCDNSDVDNDHKAKRRLGQEHARNTASSDGDEDMNDEDLGIVMPIPDAQRHASMDDHQQDVLSQDSIVALMNSTIGEVINVIQIAPTTARMLLHHFKWDREKLMESYYDCPDLDKFFIDARVVNPFNKDNGNSTGSCGNSLTNRAATSKTSPSSSQGQSKSTQKSGVLTRSNASKLTSLTTVEVPSSFNEDNCAICLCSASLDLMTGLECGHRFCSPCWVHYLTTKIMDEGMGQTISCAAYGCDILVDDTTVMRLITDKRVRSRYQHLITNSFVECNRLLRWCPSPDCSNVIKVNYADTRPVTCKCGLMFCFTCGHQWHDPVNCRLLKKWIKKCGDESETSNWIAANTKECPKCHVTIEKDGGCNHMTCKSQTCKWEFCWVCLGPWQPHGSTWYACNRFDDASAKAARDAQERSRAALQRYLHYSNRYSNHLQSLKFENKLYATAKSKMEQMQQHNMSWIEVQFLKKAIDNLCQCRRTLMYTYVFAYYLTKNNQTLIFEDNQQDLELATEQLSEFLERDLEKENLETLKQKVQDKYRYCENRRKVLLDHCHEGDEKGWWIFSD